MRDYLDRYLAFHIHRDIHRDIRPDGVCPVCSSYVEPAPVALPEPEGDQR